MSFTVLIVPTSPDEPNYVQYTQLDGVVYQLNFRYNSRENTYRFDIALDDGTRVRDGVKIVCGISLLNPARWNPLCPKGILLAVPQNADDSPPGLGDLGEGRRVLLQYISAADVAAFVAGDA